MKQALLLVAHGSRQDEANEDLRQVAADLRRLGGFDIVEESFLELAQPTIAAAGASCVQQGATRVVLVPYFLAAGVHVQKDLTFYRDELSRGFPKVDFRLAAPLGRDPLLLEILITRAREAFES
jgi:sirohydrochlorin ferrochelatase